jgi:hypothetical protein
MGPGLRRANSSGKPFSLLNAAGGPKTTLCVMSLRRLDVGRGHSHHPPHRIDRSGRAMRTFAVSRAAGTLKA